MMHGFAYVHIKYAMMHGFVYLHVYIKTCYDAWICTLKHYAWIYTLKHAMMHGFKPTH